MTGVPDVLVAASIVITEIMYHTCAEQDTPRKNWEYFEIHNPGTEPLDLSGWIVSQDVSFQWPENSALRGGAYDVVAESPDKFIDGDYDITDGCLAPCDGVQIWEWDTGLSQLNNFDGQIEITNGDTYVRMDYVHYGNPSVSDYENWPDAYDNCRSLELSDVNAENGAANNAGNAWCLSACFGSPGAPNNCSNSSDECEAP